VNFWKLGRPHIPQVNLQMRFPFLILHIYFFNNQFFRFPVKDNALKWKWFFLIEDLILNNFQWWILVGHVYWLINVRKYFLDVCLKFHVFEGEIVDVDFYMVIFLLLENTLPLLSMRKLVRDFNFSWREILFSSTVGAGVGNLFIWVGCWSIAPRCCIFRSNIWRLDSFIAGTLSFLLVELIGIEHHFQVTNNGSSSA